MAPWGSTQAGVYDQNDVQAPYLSPAANANGEQKRIIEVHNSRGAKPKVEMYQLNDRRFKADFAEKPSEYIPWEYDGTKDYPQVFSISNWKLDMTPYKPITKWSDKTGKDYYEADLSTFGVADAEYTPFNGVYIGSNAVPDNKYLTINIETQGNKSTSNEPFSSGNRITVEPFSVKRHVTYDIDMMVYWKGQVITTKTLNASTTKTSLTIGETSASTATVTTTGYQASGGPVDVNNNTATTTWSSSNSAVAEVNPASGRITAKGAGTAAITVRWKKTDEYGLSWDITRSFTVTVTSTGGGGGGGTPPSGNITGDFTVHPTTIEYRDSFSLTPTNVTEINGCTYQKHHYKFERDGVTVEKRDIIGKTAATSISYSNYPSNIGVGSVYIYMQLVGSCGESEWIGPRTLTVLGPADNNPPSFQIGFVKPYEPTVPVYQVVEGTTLNLVYINDPSVPTPRDPDGDALEFRGFDFSGSSAWAKTIPQNYSESVEGYYGIVMNGLGFHNNIKATMCDSFGACTTRTTNIEVVPPNPIAIINGPDEVVEDRPLSSEFSSAASYSPMGRSIDHSRDEWTNKKSVYTTPGTELITLHVYDSIGMKSAQPATKSLTVKPDLPPVNVLEYNSPGVRNAKTTLKDASYSPDGDTIVERDITYRYDADNDGDFNEEPVYVASLTDSMFSITPTKVGKYQIRVYTEEDWGRNTTTFHIFEVVNDSPLVSFDISSEVTEPVPITTVSIPSSTFVTSADWTNSNLLESNLVKSWKVNTRTGGLTHIPSIYKYATDISGPGPGATVGPRFDPRGDSVVYLGDGDYTRSSSPEYVQGSDPYKQLVYTRYDPSSGPSVYRTYRKSDYLTWPRGKPIEEYTSHNPRRQWPVDNQGYGLYFRYSSANSLGYLDAGSTSDIYYWWADYKLYNWDNLESHYHMYTAETPYDSRMTSQLADGFMRYYSIYVRNGKYTVFDPETGQASYYNSMTPATVDSDRFIPKLDGKAVIYGFNVYSSPEQQLIQSLPGGITARWGNYLLGQESGKYVGYYWNNDGTLTRLWSRSSTYLGGYSNGGLANLDNRGYLYVADETDKKLKRLKITDGSLETIADLSSMWNKWNGSARLVGDGAVMVEGYWYDSDTPTAAFVYDVTRPELQGALASQQQLLGKIHMQNVALNYKVRFYKLTNDRLYSGFSFHAQDHANMYRVELNGERVRLVKVQGGTRTVLSSVNYSIPESALTTVKVQSLDGTIKVYINGVPVIEKYDITFKSGTFGPYSEIPKTEFFSVSYSDLNSLSSRANVMNVAVAGQTVQYTTTLTDTENDPLIPNLTQWNYLKVAEKFLDAGDGKSGTSTLHNKTFSSPQTVFDKVGVYEVRYTAVDDPHPDYLYPAAQFSAYRKNSNTAVRTVTVHRIPTVDYDVAVNLDGTIRWTDRSHDKDRWLNSSTYSTEPTGIDYAATKGILEKKFYYVTPSGETVSEKLVVPEEAGTYTVAMAVKDEYGAWSPFLEKSVAVSGPATPNDPPVAGFTLSAFSTYRGLPITINSTASDKEDGARENLPHEYYIQNTAGGLETLQSKSRTSWQKTFNSLGTFRIRQVVSDSLGQTAQATAQVNVHNRKPVVRVTSPASQDQLYPDIITTTRPTFTWMYSDDDGDAQAMYQVRIFRYGGVMEYDSGMRVGSAGEWASTADMPENVNLYVQVRASDGEESAGFGWGDWSEPRYFRVVTNKPPEADFEWAPNPAWEGDTVTLIDRSTDPESQALTYSWRISGPNGYTRSYNSQTASIPSSDTRNRPGAYTVTLTVSDPAGAADSVTRTVMIGDLDIAGKVSHTPEWESYRQIWNAKFPKQGRAPSDFWAGEAFVLRADVTDSTGSGTKPSSVTAELLQSGDEIRLSSKDDVRFSGTMAEENHADALTDGPYTMRFTVVWSNGHVEIDDVPFTVKGNMLDVIVQQQRL